jgi:two-component system sensor histidine kinase RegB
MAGMAEKVASSHRASHVLELRWLIMIRWTALCSYALILAAAIGVLEFDADITTLSVVLALGAVSNIALAWLASSRIAAQLLMGCAIAFDVILLAALLYLCGGFTNPFSMMFLVQVTLAAFFLDVRWTWGIFALATLAFLGLFFFHVSVPQLEMHHHGAHMHASSHAQGSGFSLHLHGMLVAFIVIGAITSFFVTRMNRELASQEAELEELREKEMQRRQLLSLATITGGAAHELATPLATISLIVDDFVAHSGLSASEREDVELMKRELERCNGVLHKMRGGGGELQGEAPALFTVQSVFGEIQGMSDRVVCRSPISAELQLYSLKESLLASLRALVKNGLQADPQGQSKVEVEATLSEHDATFTVRDEGHGMSPEIQRRCGEPFFTSKPPGEGMGLGVYLVKLFVSQLNGDFHLTSIEGEGTQVTFTIPRRMSA